MEMWLGILAWGTVHALAFALLVASGTWTDLFGRRRFVAPRRRDPLSQSPMGWIENHQFWTLTSSGPETDQDETDQDETAAFWGAADRKAQ